VVLVDCDIRKPSVIGGFRDLADKGLVDYLLHEAEYDEIIGHKNEYLDVINGIRNSNFAADLLKSERMRKLVERLRGEYDYVILDSPPSALMADAQSLVGIADCAIYVVCQDYTRKSRIIDGMNNLSSPNLRFIGYVLNNSSSSTNYGKYGKYSYGKYSFDKYSYGKYGYGAYGAYSKPKSE
ncbi:MAG: CpsD/CapB family tyrosine-protein kinase, partial [Clostridiales bacterium]|nr:CpsD/CapB family tyrosine-protein kinase [Clostridiales bacterium]MDY5701894.1 CpsD/CapB family tyrosine-protein kinase [Eubacteriales bacterium]